jgi:uncharacterized membrane protein YhaH (DUF805 family)
MNVAALLFSRSGRLAPGPFAAATVLVYVISFLSQALLSGQVTVRAGLWPFALLQAALVWTWLVLHIKRLRDAGRPLGMAIGIAGLYVLALMLLLLVMVMITANEFSGNAAKAGQGLLQLFMALHFIGILIGHADLGAFGLWLMGFLMLLLTPLIVALGFSIWTGTRPSVPAPP